MLHGWRGRLVSEYYAEMFLGDAFCGHLGETNREKSRAALLRWWRERASEVGPATSLRALFDRAVEPLFTWLGYDVSCGTASPNGEMLTARARADVALLGVVATGWRDDLDRAWRRAVEHGLGLSARWAFCANVTHLRIVDVGRSYSRSFVEFDLEAAAHDERTFAALWALARADAFSPRAPSGRSVFDEIVAASARHATGVSQSLRVGVLDALVELLRGLAAPSGVGRATRKTDDKLAAIFEQALTVVYRILFLLFAEARGLVPIWHPIYRDNYTIESLRAMVEDPRRPRGLWEALQAISRLAHAGCRAGDLTVTPFNGRLFAPARTPLADTAKVPEEPVRRAILALSTRRSAAGSGRERISYRDLGVEQLGAVYEHVLDYQPALEPSARGPASIRLRGGSGRRKSSGTFYTPRSITDYLVRVTLHPLVENAGPDEVLRLRVLDPAMGSGAFLVGACRFLAAAYERALIASGACQAHDIDDQDRAKFRRLIAQRCLYGVDLNPMAVQLARLSLWLATLAGDRPLTFLDHHLRAGDSLIGASLDDVARRPPAGPSARDAPPRELPLFAEDAGDALRQVLPDRQRLAIEPDDSLESVRDKERTLARLEADGSAIARWKAVADLWTASWFQTARDARPSPGLFAELTDALLRGRSALPAHVEDAWLTDARRIAGAHRFFHWTLEFPEVFYGPDGRALANPGFDAVLGNPPWDMVRADDAEPDERPLARHAARHLTGFARRSGVYLAQSRGHANRYQLFVERAIRLARRGGRVGLVAPWGLAADHGCGALRRLLLDRCDTEALVGFDNQRAIFPIHRSVRFVLLTATAGARTTRLRCRFGERDPAALDALPDALDAAPQAFPIVLSPASLSRLSGDDLAIPDLREARDLELLERLVVRFPALADPRGWGAEFGRELNASDDRGAFTREGPGLPVLEGKHVKPFIANVEAATLRIPEERARRLLNADRTFTRPRLAYRDVASATNRTTLIAAVVPAGCVTVHTLFCLKTPLDADEQAVLCALLNSYVANYLVRLRVTTHVSASIVRRLPAPRPERERPEFQELAALADRLSRGVDPDAEARLQGLAARLYRLAEPEFLHVLGTFPLVDDERKQAALAAFRSVGR